MISISQASKAAPFLAVAFTLLLQTGCASKMTDGNSESFSGGAPYFDSAFNDHNRAPASLTPMVSDGNGVRVDPVYLRTQADYFYSLGEANSLDGRHEAAIEAFKSVLVYDANSATVHERIASEYVKLGVVTAALEHAEIAIAKEPKSVEGHLLLGGIESSLKEYDKAIKEYDKVLKLEPGNVEAPLYMGAVYAEMKDYEKSVKYFKMLADNEEYTTAYLAYYYIGRVRLEQELPSSERAAETAFRKSMELKPGYVDAAVALAGMYQRNEQDERAISLLKGFQKEHGPNSRVAEVLSQLYLDRENYDQAMEQLEILEGGSEDTLNIKVRMALIMIEQKKFDKAIVKLQEILKQVPESDKIQFYLAAIYEETKEPDKAVDCFKKIGPHSSFYAEAVIHETYILKNQKKVDQALKAAREAYLARQDNPQIIAVYASLLDEKKDFNSAVDVLKKGIDQFPDQVQLKFFMGTVQDHLGNKDQVITQMKSVVELDPNHVQGLNYLAFTYADEGKNLDEAEKLVRRALEIEPHDGYILDTLGWVLFKRGQYNQSIQILESAFKRQPSESVIAEHLGDAYLKTQLMDKAKKMFERAVELETETGKVESLKAKITAIDKPATKLPVENTGNRLPASTP